MRTLEAQRHLNVEGLGRGEIGKGGLEKASGVC